MTKHRIGTQEEWQALYGASADGVLPTAVGFSMCFPGFEDGLPSVGLSI
jgi:hypothetical protein